MDNTPTTPLNDAHPGGYFFARIMTDNAESRIFQKPPLSLEEQLDLLKSRGLGVPSDERALHYLRYVGYYRLSGYCRYFQQNTSDSFREGVIFDSILDLYIFDRRLRLLVLDAIERIEVAVRTGISNAMSESNGSHWFLDRDLFVDLKRHDELISNIKDATQDHDHQEGFLKEYFRKYDQPPLPPSWMLTEVMPIGTWSILFANLKHRSIQKRISFSFGIDPKVMRSWLHTLTYLRNLCAHHKRLWNRRISITPIIMKKHQKHMRNNSSFYASAIILQLFMNVIADGSRWKYRMFELFKTHPAVPIQEMGFYDGWEQDPFWNINS